MIRNILFSLSLFINCIAWSQITSSGHVNVLQTAYTNGRPNDNVYVYCGTQLGQANGSLTATSSTGTGPFSFTWSYYNEVNNSWAVLRTDTGSSSTIENLPSDGYQVTIRDVNNLEVGCFVAWVWNLNVQATASNNPLLCNSTNLVGTGSAESSFNYYNVPPGQSLITSNTQISVCFSAQHTYVSDLGFFLRAPNGTVITLSPNPGAISQGSTCNSGDNVNNLCFSTTATANLNVCTASTPLTGSYRSYGATPTQINWTPLVGLNAAQGGWAVQIYDCIGADRGALTNAVITFTNLDVTGSCDAQENITYSSGTISSAINDNSCNAATASIFAVPLPINLTTPITLTAVVSGEWTASNTVPQWNGTTSNQANGTLTNLPAGETDFVYTVSAMVGGVACSNSASTTFTNTCCTAAVNITASEITICPEEEVTVQATAQGTHFQWSPSEGITDSLSIVTNVALANSALTVMQRWYYLTAYDSINECQLTDSVLVNVHGMPFAQIDTVVCQQTLQVNGTISTNQGGWYVANDNTQRNFAGINPILEFPTAGVYTVAYMDGCQNTVDFIVRRVQPIELAGDTSFCGSQFLFDPLDLNGYGGNWTVDAGGFIREYSSSSLQLFSGNTQTTIYTLTLTDSICGFNDSRRVEMIILPTLTGPEYSCFMTALDVQAVSHSGGVWDLVRTEPANLNLDSFRFEYPLTNSYQTVVAGEAGKYILSFTDETCGFTEQITLNFLPYVWTEIADTSICVNSSYEVVAWQPPYAVDYLWNTGSREPSIWIGAPGVYTLTVFNLCHSYTDTAVITSKICDIEAPNVISLSSKVGNEFWFVKYEGIQDYECVIIDRWGNVVKTINSVQGYWDGTNRVGKTVSEGVYFYKIIAETEGSQELKKQGFIQVID